MPVVQQGDIEPAERAKLGTFTRELRDCAFQGNAVSGSPPNHEPRTGSIISRRWRSLIIASAVVIPVLLYRRSWSWWLMAYFYFLPHKLPNNQDAPRDDEER